MCELQHTRLPLDASAFYFYQSLITARAQIKLAISKSLSNAKESLECQLECQLAANIGWSN